MFALSAHATVAGWSDRTGVRWRRVMNTGQVSAYLGYRLRRRGAGLICTYLRGPCVNPELPRILHWEDARADADCRRFIRALVLRQDQSYCDSCCTNGRVQLDGYPDSEDIPEARRISVGLPWVIDLMEGREALSAPRGCWLGFRLDASLQAQASMTAKEILRANMMGQVAIADRQGPLQIDRTHWIFKGWMVQSQGRYFRATAVAGVAPAYPCRAHGAISLPAACAAISAMYHGSMLGFRNGLTEDPESQPSQRELVRVSPLRLAVMLLLQDPLDMLQQAGYLEFRKDRDVCIPHRLPMAALDVKLESLTRAAAQAQVARRPRPPSQSRYRS